MNGFSRLAFFAALTLVLPGPAMGQEVPEGWHLQEEEASGVTDLTLAWYEKGSGEVKIALNCQENYADVVLTIYVDEPAAPSAAPVAVVLEKDGTRFAFESPVSDYNGHSVGTITSFGPELTALLQGGFAVSLDGAAHGSWIPAKTLAPLMVS